LLEHTTTTAGQIPERLQLHSLLLPNGRLAHTLDRDALFRELKAIGVKNVVPQDGHQTLLVALAWTIRSGNVIAIPESGSPGHVKENAVALTLTLTPQELQTLDAAHPPPHR
jgi:diketogulonate reductase-like aldo/keto reductase